MREGPIMKIRDGAPDPNSGRGLGSPVEALCMTKNSPPPMPMLWAFRSPTQSREAMAASTAEPFLFRMSLGTQQTGHGNARELLPRSTTSMKI